jgi:hypothetical protein
MGRPEADRAALLRDSKRMRKVLDDLVDEHREEFGRPPQLRHILLYLLFPDDYERIASEGHKARICEAFAEVIDGEAPEDADDRLKVIRTRLQELLPEKELDYYWPPLRACWYTDSEGDDIGSVQALRLKKADRPLRAAGYWEDVPISRDCRDPDPAGTAKTVEAASVLRVAEGCRCSRFSTHSPGAVSSGVRLRGFRARAAS